MTTQWRGNFSQGSFFGVNLDNPGGLHLNFIAVQSADSPYITVRTETSVTDTFEGPPGHVHGGISSAILDETMGNVCFKNGYFCVSANQITNWLRPTPLNTPLHIEGWIEKVEGEKVYPKSRLMMADGTVLVTAHGLYVHRPDLFKKFGATMGMNLPNQKGETDA